MRILHLDSGREMRGGQWQVLRLHKGLIERGHDSMLLARDGSPLLAAVRKLALPCEPLSLMKIRGRADLVHAHDARSHTLAALLAKPPLVVSRRVAFPIRDSAASRWKYRRPTLFIAVSNFVARELTLAGVPADRIAVVYDGVPVPPEPSRGSDILVPETLDPEKGMALAEAAAARSGVKLKRSHNLEADLPRARALVYLSKSEGLGSGILLGMAHGVTVIASDTGGIPEMIENGVNGILVPNEEAAIAMALTRIESKLGEAARQTVQARFTESQMVIQTLAAYRRLSPV
jgi:glycosyltransferase involved in cell wall biosynthesis